jgi:hypothetical protein
LQQQQQAHSLRHQMQYQPSLLRCGALLILLSALGACDSNRGEVHVLFDGIPARDTLEVIAVPFDPVSLIVPGATEGPRADSLRDLHAIADTVQRDSERFDRERETINREVFTLRGADRTTPDYARQHDALTRRIAAAESLRALREERRSSLNTLAGKLGVPAPGTADAFWLPWAGVDSASRVARLDPVATDAAGDTVVLRLPPGRWWVTFGVHGRRLRAEGTPVQVEPRGRATIRLTR